MRIAFYAPLKPPTHPVPSGDRRMARLLMAALAQAGHTVELASRLRSRDGAGDPERQAAIAALGGRLADRLICRYRSRAPGQRPELWFTYHLYHKAPDWLGPAVAGALSIPYVAAEASHAPRQAVGPWALGHRAATAAIRCADAIIVLNPADAAGLAPALVPRERLVFLKPFLDAREFAAAVDRRPIARRFLSQQLSLAADEPWLLAVGMMRPGEKLASYRLLGEALGRLAARPWRLLVAGEGAARPEVEAALRLLGSDRVRFLGTQPPAELVELYAASDLFVWPAIGEAYGMALLEAQAAGLPAVAGACGGVPTIVEDGSTGLLVPPGDAAALANALDLLLRDPQRRAELGTAARRRAAREHDLAAAARRLDEALRAAAARRRRSMEAAS